MKLEKIITKENEVKDHIKEQKKEYFDCPFYEEKNYGCKIVGECDYRKTKNCFMYGVYKFTESRS